MSVSRMLRLDLDNEDTYDCPIDIIGYNCNYDMLKVAEEKVKYLKLKQRSCNHEFSSDIYVVNNYEFISNPNDNCIINFFNKILNVVMVAPKYARVCKHCGKVAYFCSLDEAKTYSL